MREATLSERWKRRDVGRGARLLGIASIVLFVGGPASAHQAMVSPVAGFLAFVAGGILALVAVFAGVVQTFRWGLGAGRPGVLLGAVPAATLVYLAAQALPYPPINDVSTDLDDPPEFEGAARAAARRGRDLSFPRASVSVIRRSYPDLGPLEVPEPAARVFDRALLVAQGMPRWRVTVVDRDRLVFEGVATSRIYRFRDDFVVRVRPTSDGSRVDMRSKSRDGKGDLGANAARIREFLGKLRAASGLRAQWTPPPATSIAGSTPIRRSALSQICSRGVRKTSSGVTSLVSQAPLTISRSSCPGPHPA